MKKQLPMYGIGPFYVGMIALTTAWALLLQHQGVLPVLTLPGLHIPQTICGGILITAGALLWFSGAILSRLGKHIRSGELITEGIYAWVRNPIYTAFLFAAWGVILLNDNLFLWILGLVHWMFLTVLLKFTEEIWLLDAFGGVYQEYCHRVNRCLPWVPLKEDGALN